MSWGWKRFSCASPAATRSERPPRRTLLAGLSQEYFDKDRGLAAKFFCLAPRSGERTEERGLFFLRACMRLHQKRSLLSPSLSSTILWRRGRCDRRAPSAAKTPENRPVAPGFSNNGLPRPPLRSMLKKILPGPMECGLTNPARAGMQQRQFAPHPPWPPWHSLYFR